MEELKYVGKTLIKQNSIRKKLRADFSQGLLVIVRCRIFCLPVCYPKILRLR
jgi:hypothetical protein